MRNGGGDTERKVLKDTQPLWAVRLPEPPTGAVSCSFDPDAVVLDAAEVLALTVVRADDTVNGIDAHRLELTASAAGLAPLRRGVAGIEYGAAFVITQDGAWFPVVVSSIRDGKIILAEALPRGVEIDAGNTATVRYATYTGVLPAAVSATATATTPIRWQVNYAADLGADLPAHPAQRMSGMLHIRERIFDTGLTHHTFVETMRGVAGPDAVYGRQSSWEPQIAAAELMLVQWIRKAVTEGTSANREDDVDGGAFRMAHAYWTAAMAERDPEARASLKADAEAAAQTALDSLIVTNPTSKLPEASDHGARAALLFGGSTLRTSDSATTDYYVGRPL